ncbi:MAG: HU family DNA-binding protein [Patescibacteria group bacterium]
MQDRINQKDLARILKEKKKNQDLKLEELENLIKSISDEIIDQLKNNRSVKITSFGTFSAKARYARKAVNPRNIKEIIDISETKVVKFKAGKKLKDSLKS